MPDPVPGRRVLLPGPPGVLVYALRTTCPACGRQVECVTYRPTGRVTCACGAEVRIRLEDEADE